MVLDRPLASVDAVASGEPAEELEPLFDYSRVQPFDIVCLDDDISDASPVFCAKKQKVSSSTVDKKQNDGEVIQIVDCEEENKAEKEEEDWLAPPPEISYVVPKISEDPTLKELRLKKQELASFANSAEDVFRAVEESIKRERNASSKSSLYDEGQQPPGPPVERTKIIISIQDKDELKQYRVYSDDKFERLFRTYADKVKLDVQKLSFTFDGDRISPAATPQSLGMEDDDIIEVHVKSS